VWTRVYRLEAADRIADPILRPSRSGGSFCITRAHAPRHHGIYRPKLEAIVTGEASSAKVIPLRSA